MEKPQKSKRIQKIAIIYGGWSGEREVSINSGNAVNEALLKIGKYKTVLIDYKKDLVGFIEEVKAAEPDIAFIATHGIGGEDGILQSILEILEIPYTHSSVTTSALAMDKVLSRIIFETVGILTPQWKIMCVDDLRSYGSGLKFPYVIKPKNEGSSIGVSIIHDPKELENALTEWTFGNEVLIEDYIKGREIQVAVLDGKALGAIEIKPHGDFFDYKCKYSSGEADHIMPAPLSKKDYKEILDISENAHKSLLCSGVSRLDFIYGNDEKFYLLELNTQPGLTSVSLLPEIARYIGISFQQLIEKIIESAVKK